VTHDAESIRASARLHGAASPVEIVTNGQVIASGEGAVEAVTAPGWMAVRCPMQSGFAHTSPIATGERARKPEALAALRILVEQTREWAETVGRFANPKRKQTLFDRCDEAVRKLEARAWTSWSVRLRYARVNAKQNVCTLAGTHAAIRA